MNKQYIAFLLCFVYTTAIWTMQNVTYNRKKISQHFNDYSPTQDNQKILGYNPQIRFVHNEDQQVQHQRVSLFVHGFGGDGDNIDIIQENNPSDFITFNLPDHNFSKSKINITKTSFGGQNEILPLIYTLNTMNNAGINAVDLVSFSRGAATTINTLASLIEPSESLEFSLQKLNITADDRKKILSMIHNGTITLWWPLRDFKTLIEEKIDIIIDSCSPQRLFIRMPRFIDIIRSFELFWIWMPVLSKSIIKSFAYYAIPLVTSHKWHERTVTESLGLLNEKDLKFKIMTLLQPNDQVVHNTNEGAYIEALPTLPEHKYVGVGICGDHMKTDWNVDLAVKIFRMNYGCSYSQNLKISVTQMYKVGNFLTENRVSEIIKKHKSVQSFLDTYYTKDTPDKETFWQNTIN